jgi:hypothetical protein
VTGRPVADLWRAARVLLLPVLAILLAGTLAAGVVVAVPVWLLAAIVLWRALRRLEERSGAAVLQDAALSAVSVLGLALVAGSTAVFLVFKSSSMVDAWDAWSQLLVWAGFVAWGLALGLRLVGYTRSWVRLAITAGIVAMAVRYFFGLFVVGDDLSLGLVDHLVWAALLVALLLVAVVGEQGHEVPAGRQRAWTRGLAAALVASAAFVAASLTGMLSDPPIGRVKMPFKEVAVAKFPALAEPDISPWIDRPRELARRFAPVLELTDDERWQPAPVDEFLGNAELQLRDGTPRQAPPVREGDLPTRCPGGGRRACYQLTIDCSLERRARRHGTGSSTAAPPTSA